MDQKEAERTSVLTRDTYYQAFDGLQAALPPPKKDDAEDQERRDNRAMAEVAGLVPVSAAEVKLAVLFVASSARAEAFLGTIAGDDVSAEKAPAHAASMMRQSFVALSLLMRLQAARAKRDANNASADSAAWTEHYALEHMTEARVRLRRASAEAGPTAAPDASFSETISRSAGDETDARRAGAVSTPESEAANAPTPPAVSDSETASQLSVNETAARQVLPTDITPSSSPAMTSTSPITPFNQEADAPSAGTAFVPDNAPDSAPTGPAVSNLETLSRLTGNETHVRASVPPDHDLTASRLRPPGPAMATIIPPHQHPDANAAIQSASG